MGSFILRTVRPDALQAWIKANAPGSVRGTPRDSWRAYLVAQGAVGSTLADLELSFTGGKNLSDAFTTKVSAATGATTKEKARSFYK